MSDTVHLTIDDLEMTVPEGTLIVDAAKRHGIDIPVFCYHPNLSSVGMCRMCLVEVGTPVVDRESGEVRKDEEGNPVLRWFPQLQTACTMAVSEGMVVRTQTERVAQARRDVIEFLLTSHPLDCPICDKGGECPLQNQTMAYGPGVSRFNYGDKQRLAKRFPLGELIVLDQERCIQCGRCIRFQDEIADDPVLEFAERGRKMQIITSSDPPFDSYFGGNTTDICPVGALTTADFRFAARPWELTHHASLCNHCPVGCNVMLDTRVEGKPSPGAGHSPGGRVIKRVMPRQNKEVNQIWICDKGRYGHHHARAGDRLTTPLIRRNGALKEATWDEALTRIAKRIKAAPSAQIAGVAGDRLSNEDLFLFQALLRDVIGTPHIDVYPGAPGVDLVARYGIGADSDWQALKEDSVILVVAGDVEEQAPIWFLQVKAAARRGVKLIVVNGRETKLDRYADRTLRVRYGSPPHLLVGVTKLLLEHGVDLDPDLEGLDKFQEDLTALDLDAVERLTGVGTDDVRAVAETLAQAQNVVLLFGREGLNDYGAMALAQAAANLLVATGHVGRADNGLLPLWPHNNTQGASDMGVRPNAGPGYQDIVEHGWDFDSMMSTARDGGIKLMWIAAADLVGDDPAYAEVLEALDFLIVQELFLTDTARRADVVLPALSFAERDGTYTSGDRRVQRFEQALPPLGAADDREASTGRPDWEIFADVGGRLGAQWDFGSSAGVLAAINERVPLYAGMTLKALRETEPQWPPVGGDALSFGGTAYQNMGGLGLRWPAMAEAEEAERALDWVELPTLHDAGLIAVPVRWLYRRGTLIERSALLEQRLRDAEAALSPQDAAALDLTPGASVKAGIGGRTAQLTVRLAEDVPPGVVLVPSHLPTGPVALEPIETAESAGGPDL